MRFDWIHSSPCQQSYRIRSWWRLSRIYKVRSSLSRTHYGNLNLTTVKRGDWLRFGGQSGSSWVVEPRFSDRYYPCKQAFWLDSSGSSRFVEIWFGAHWTALEEECFATRRIEDVCVWLREDFILWSASQSRAQDMDRWRPLPHICWTVQLLRQP